MPRCPPARQECLTASQALLWLIRYLLPSGRKVAAFFTRPPLIIPQRVSGASQPQSARNPRIHRHSDTQCSKAAQARRPVADAANGRAQACQVRELPDALWDGASELVAVQISAKWIMRSRHAVVSAAFIGHTAMRGRLPVCGDKKLSRSYSEPRRGDTSGVRRIFGRTAGVCGGERCRVVQPDMRASPQAGPYSVGVTACCPLPGASPPF